MYVTVSSIALMVIGVGVIRAGLKRWLDQRRTQQMSNRIARKVRVKLGVYFSLLPPLLKVNYNILTQLS